MEKIFLYDEQRAALFRPHLEIWSLAEKEQRGSVLVFPGGGYAIRSPHEGRAVAKAYNQAGFHAYVLQYRTARHPAPLQDAFRAMEIIRKKEKDDLRFKGKIAVCGFSAGGHLAASLALLDSPQKGSSPDQNTKPDALVLCYPLLSFKEYSHKESIKNLLGRNPDPLEINTYHLVDQVKEDSPPAFLWHTADDLVVPVENSLIFCESMSKNKRPFQLHVFPKGKHGLGLAKRRADISKWFEMSCSWLRSQGW